ncbi:methyltransferase domain-containing protein, putative [Eimeria maxima]|uniref:Methyltransferase domain-containing protein, putative n=1 Tax=Eimeria maxima TaxID=5804 RepID=U6LYA8_EIMMA|nr:methyltransferase domain-containing protein, putative [Eimeria maxima]CDJ56721.1 methyltransferase domain-containing protein, putative [Eimeria maxima]
MSGYLDALYNMTVSPLAYGGDPQETVNRLSLYGLRREHLLDHMQSLMLKKQTRLYDSVESKAKAAFTRLCSQQQQQQQQQQIKVKKGRSSGESLKEVMEREENGVSSEETDEEETEGDTLAAKGDTSNIKKRGGGGGAAAKTQTAAGAAAKTRGNRQGAPRDMLQQRTVRIAAGVCVFGASAYLGFNYKLSSSPIHHDEPFPTEAERRHVFFTKAEHWDRDVAFQELLLGIGRMRKELARQARGDVLEVAAGTGRNFRYYDKEKVKSLTVTDFCSTMLDQAKAKKGDLGDIKVDFFLANSCKLPKEKKYDTILQTFALCSYEDPVKTLEALGDNLMPAGFEVVSMKRRNLGE